MEVANVVSATSDTRGTNRNTRHTQEEWRRQEEEAITGQGSSESEYDDEADRFSVQSEEYGNNVSHMGHTNRNNTYENFC